MTGDAPNAYRFLTSDDDTAFCQRVSYALRAGDVLQGLPLLQVDAEGTRHCGQAVVLPEFASANSAVTGSEN